MELKDFGKFLRKKSIPKLLHRARKQSLDRLAADEIEVARTVRPRRTGTR